MFIYIILLVLFINKIDDTYTLFCIIEIDRINRNVKIKAISQCRC